MLSAVMVDYTELKKERTFHISYHKKFSSYVSWDILHTARTKITSKLFVARLGYSCSKMEVPKFLIANGGTTKFPEACELPLICGEDKVVVECGLLCKCVVLPKTVDCPRYGIGTSKGGAVGTESVGLITVFCEAS